MAKPLSQEEIDVLLEVRRQLDGADECNIDTLESIIESDAKQRVQPYNFKRPRLFSQDQMRVLNYVHESFARDLSVYLSAQLRTMVDVGLKVVDQVLYSEYVMSSAPPSAVYVVDAENLGHKLIVEIDPRLVVYTIEKLCGGPGIFPERSREVSQIEQRIMSKVMLRAYGELEKAWKQIHELTLRELAFESHAEFVQIIPAVEPALVASFEVSIYDQHSFIHVCYPYILLERMLGRGGMEQWISNATTPISEKARSRYEGIVRSVSVESRAELGRSRLFLQDLLNLQVGDVIPLDRRVNEPITVYIDGKEKFKAVAGRSGKYRALRILEIAPSNFSDNDDE